MTEKGPSWGDMANTTWGDLLARDPPAVEIGIEQKLLDLIAELETLKARVAELEARVMVPLIPDSVKARTFGRAHEST